MSSEIMLARPYAKAIFELAFKDNTLDFWSEVLTLLSIASNDIHLQSAYRDPQFSKQDINDIYIAVLKKAHLHNVNTENLILLLAHYRRLILLPTIQMLYEQHKAQIEKVIHVSVVSASNMSIEVRENLKKALEKRFMQQVELEYSEDSTLMGGAIITAGDWVMDYSVKSQLSKLEQILVS